MQFGGCSSSGGSSSSVGRSSAQLMLKVAGSSPACHKPPVWKRTLNPLTAPISEKISDTNPTHKSSYMSETVLCGIYKPEKKLYVIFQYAAIAVLCGAAATNSALIELSSSKFSRPCYLASAAVDSATAINRPAVQAMHCCGTGRNISRFLKE
jgi:hypothetical protein